MACGGAESDYRPGRWGSFREPYKFSGKEEDVEVGLQYFGARYLVVGLGRWASADAATIHYFRADPNPYAYVAGRPTVAVDPNGNEAVTVAAIITAVVVGAIIGAVVGGAVNAGMQWHQKKRLSQVELGEVGIAMGAGAAAGAAGGGAGAAVGGAAASAGWAPRAAGAATGAAGGAVSGATSYLFTAAAQGERVDYGRLAASAGVGAGAGAVTGGIVGAATAPSPMAPPPPGRFEHESPTFSSEREANTWFRDEFTASSVEYDVEYRAALYRNGSGEYEFRNFSVGEPGVGHVDSPPARLAGLRSTIHSHGGKSAAPSEGVFKFHDSDPRVSPVEPGDQANSKALSAQAKRPIPVATVGGRGEVYRDNPRTGIVDTKYIPGPASTRVSDWPAAAVGPGAGFGYWLGRRSP